MRLGSSCMMSMLPGYNCNDIAYQVQAYIVLCYIILLDTDLTVRRSNQFLPSRFHIGAYHDAIEPVDADATCMIVSMNKIQV